MPSILFLSDPVGPPANDNHLTLPDAFRRAGWRVDVASHALHWIGGEVRSGNLALPGFDLVWPIGLGHRADFVDRMQLLAHSGARLINPPSAYLLLHGKLMWSDLLPRTHASADPEVLVARLPDCERWVLKPAAASFGRGVTRLGRADAETLRAIMGSTPGTWFLLQEERPEITRGEHRTLVAGGERIGSYRREPGSAGVANLAAGGIAIRGEPGVRENQVIEEVLARLRRHRVGFAAIDTSGEFLVEINLANPGGLGTLQRVWAHDFGPELVAAVTRWIEPSTRRDPRVGQWGV